MSERASSERRRPVGWIAAVLAGWVVQASAAPLPGAVAEPLTLHGAFALALDTHPRIARALSDVALARAEGLAVQSRRGIGVAGNVRIGVIEPNVIARDQSHQDASAGIRISRPVLDFGRTDAEYTAAAAELAAAEQALRAARNGRAVSILRHYLEVVAADLHYAVAQEDQAVRFVRWERAQTRQTLGAASDLTVRDLHVGRQGAVRRNLEAQARQRATRERLALAMGRPGQLASTVAAPALAGNRRAVPEWQPVLDAVLADSPELGRLHDRVRAADARYAGARKGAHPTVAAQLEAFAYQRDLGGRDTVRAALVMQWPIFSGGRVDAAVAKAAAQRDQARAELQQAQWALRQASLDAWQGLKIAHAKVAEAQALMDFRTLEMDRARGEYELGFRADLGDAMVRWSRARLQHAAAQHELAMQWAELDALRGHAVADRVLGIGVAAAAREFE